MFFVYNSTKTRPTPSKWLFFFIFFYTFLFLFANGKSVIYGVLQDKKATGHPSIVSKLEGNVIVDSQVVIDGGLITCRGLSSTPEFALAVIAKFFGHGRAKSVASGLVYEYRAT